MSETHEEQLEHLQIVFDRLRKHGLRMNPSKCSIGQSEVQYLGYTISKEGYKPPQERVDAIINYPKPKNVKEVRKFLGLLNYYRKLIPNAAKVQAPLHEYLKDSKKTDKRVIKWTPEAEEAFATSRKSLASIARTADIHPSGPLILSTDASDTAIGAALEQTIDNVATPVGFFSRKLSQAEKNYSTYDRELLAVFAAIKYFQHLLECRNFIIKTDQKPLTYAFAQKAEKASPRQARQLNYISQFSTEIEHVCNRPSPVN